MSEPILWPEREFAEDVLGIPFDTLRMTRYRANKRGEPSGGRWGQTLGGTTGRGVLAYSEYNVNPCIVQFNLDPDLVWARVQAKKAFAAEQDAHREARVAEQEAPAAEADARVEKENQLGAELDDKYARWKATRRKKKEAG